MQNFNFAGIGKYIPQKILTNEDIENLGIGASANWICANTGIMERRIATSEQSSSDLAALAAKDAISNAGLQASDIDLIVMSTLTPDYLLPQTSSIVKIKIGAKNAACFDIQAACAGFVYALITALNYATFNEEINNLLVIGSDTASKFVNWGDRKSCSITGDGAGAVVMKRTSEECAVKCSYITHKSMDGINCACLPVYYGQISSPCNSYYNFDGKYLYETLISNLPDVIGKILTKAQWKIDEVDLFVFPQMNKNLILDIAKLVGFGENKAHTIMDKYGYTYNSCIPLTLFDALECGKLKRDDKVILIGAGAGTYLGGIALNWMN